MHVHTSNSNTAWEWQDYIKRRAGESVRSTATIAGGSGAAAAQGPSLGAKPPCKLTWRVNVRERWRCELLKGAYLNGLPHTVPVPYTLPLVHPKLQDLWSQGIDSQGYQECTPSIFNYLLRGPLCCCRPWAPTFLFLHQWNPPTWLLGVRVLMIGESLGWWVEASTKLDSSETKPNPVDFAWYWFTVKIWEGIRSTCHSNFKSSIGICRRKTPKSMDFLGIISHSLLLVYGRKTFSQFFGLQKRWL